MKLNLQRHKQLVDRADRLRKSGGDYVVTLLDFFHSPFADGSPYQRLATHLVDTELNAREIEIFALAEQVMAVITDPPKRVILKDVIQAARNLAPVSHWLPFFEPKSAKPFLSHYAVATESEALAAHVRLIGERESIKLYEADREMAKRKQAEARVARSKQGADQVAGANASPAQPTGSLGFHFSPALQLDFIETQLEKIDIQEFLRLQPIARFEGTRFETTIAQEIFTSVTALVTRFGAEIELDLHYLLLRHLTRHLDRHMLHHLADRVPVGGQIRLYVNLALDSLGSKAFAEFDSRQNAIQRGAYVFEISATDALADPDLFFRAVHQLTQRGYGVALDGIALETLAALDLDDLPLSAVKLVWRREYLRTMESDRQAAEAAARHTLILCHCFQADALAWGGGAGITRFQGTVVDSMCTSALFQACEAKHRLGCDLGHCRARHGQAAKEPGFACPTPGWTG